MDSKKVLIAILSCVKFSLDGSNQASRDTFLSERIKFPEADYRFFMGDGTPTGEDEFALQGAPRECGHVQLDSPRISLEGTNPYIPKLDEVVLHVPDDYVYLSWKVRAALKWALENGYEFTFMCACDTYIDLSRLKNSGFEAQDYLGRKYGHFAVGGSGYWLSRESSTRLSNEVIDDWASDRWVGTALLRHGITLHGDQRYGASPQQNPGLSNPSPLFPEEGNEQITAHLAEAPGIYHPNLMYRAHEIRNTVHAPQYISAPAPSESVVEVEKTRRTLRWTRRMT
jgi:hypothetical protein